MSQQNSQRTRKIREATSREETRFSLEEEKSSDSERAIEAPRSTPEDQVLSFDQILKTSIELDDVAKRNIEQLLVLGSKRLAPDFKEMLNDSVRAVEQNANLLRILRHKLGTARDV